MKEQKVFVSKVTYGEEKFVVICDGKCEKAWGKDLRPTEQNDLHPDKQYWLNDNELKTAPSFTSSSEGYYNKPIALPETHNGWCANECERSKTLRIEELLPNFDKRVAAKRATKRKFTKSKK
jgi:hypothetical protein